MALGRSISNQYLFQDQEGLVPARQPSTVSRQVAPSPQSEAMPDFGIGDMQDELEQVDGMTESYYNSYANLKNFARSAWQNLGIDVTSPDPTDPLAQKISRNWMKLLAETHAVGNALARGREDQVAGSKALLEDPDAVARMGTGRYGQTEAREETFGNVGISSTAESIADSLRTKFDMFGQYSQAKEERDMAVKLYDERIANETNPIRREQLIRDQEAIRKALPDFRRVDQDDKKTSGATLPQAVDRLRLIERLRDGDTDMMNEQFADKGIRFEKVQSPNRNELVISKSFKDGSQQEVGRVSFEKPGLDFEVDVNSILNSVEGFGEITNAEWKQYRDQAFEEYTGGNKDKLVDPGTTADITAYANDIAAILKNPTGTKNITVNNQKVDITRDKARELYNTINEAIISAPAGTFAIEVNGVPVSVSSVDYTNWDKFPKITYVDEDGNEETLTINPNNKIQSRIIEQLANNAALFLRDELGVEGLTSSSVSSGESTNTGEGEFNDL